MVAQLVWVPVVPPLLVALAVAQERVPLGRARGQLAAESGVQDSAQVPVRGKGRAQQERRQVPVPVVAQGQVRGRLAVE